MRSGRKARGGSAGKISPCRGQQDDPPIGRRVRGKRSRWVLLEKSHVGNFRVRKIANVSQCDICKIRIGGNLPGVTCRRYEVRAVSGASLADGQRLHTGKVAGMLRAAVRVNALASGAGLRSSTALSYRAGYRSSCGKKRGPPDLPWRRTDSPICTPSHTVSIPYAPEVIKGFGFYCFTVDYQRTVFILLAMKKTL